MIVLNARGAKLEGQKLTLDGMSPNAIIFADRPVRSAGHALTAHLLEEWSSTSARQLRQDSAQRHRVGVQQGQGRRRGRSGRAEIAQARGRSADLRRRRRSKATSPAAMAPRRSSWTSSTCRSRDGHHIKVRGTPARPSPVAAAAHERAATSASIDERPRRNAASVKRAADSGMHRRARVRHISITFGARIACASIFVRSTRCIARLSRSL